MMRRIIPIAMLLMLAGTAWGTMWLYDDPTFFSKSSGRFQPANISILEIVDAPYFPLLGQGFYTDAIPVKISEGAGAVQIRSNASPDLGPIPVTFGGHLENNLKYAQSRSSLRIGAGGSWTTFSAPGLL
ncbi:MAG: hypothetical protein QUS08_04600 [Methanothrix sp.]|nr:hypothetical protein [Methanothrix sp.]